jgi:multidrug efflux pump subunit AcrA (membrane-fusion protein)
MFVQVSVRGHVQRDRVVIPRIAIRNGHVYVVNEQSRLEVRPVSVLFHQGAISVIGAGIEAGDQIVVTDPVPAVPGMLLSLHSDDDLQRSLLSAARGER